MTKLDGMRSFLFDAGLNELHAGKRRETILYMLTRV